MIDILMPRLSDTMTEGAISTWPRSPATTSPRATSWSTSRPTRPSWNTRPTSPAPSPRSSSPRAGTPDRRAHRPPRRQESPNGRTASPPRRWSAGSPGSAASTWAAVAGSGPGGRVVRADLDASPAAVETPVPTGKDPREPLPVPFDPVRQAVAARLTESGVTSPPSPRPPRPTSTTCWPCATRSTRPTRGTGVKVNVNDLIVRAVALALRAPSRGERLLLARGTRPDPDPPAGSTSAWRSTPGGTGRAGRPGRRPRRRHRHLGHHPRPRPAGGGPHAHPRRHERRHVHRQQPRHVRRRALHRDHQPAPGGDPRGRRGAAGTTRRRLRYTITADHRIIDGALAARFLATLTGLLEHPLRVDGLTGARRISTALRRAGRAGRTSRSSRGRSGPCPRRSAGRGRRRTRRRRSGAVRTWCGTCRRT